MIRSLLFSFALLLTAVAGAQTYFYVSEIVVNPQPATTEDDISVDLIGGLSSTGAYVAGTSVSVTGSTVTITIAAADPGGLTVIVPHTETVAVGQLPAGVYTIVLQMQGVGDFAPEPQHTFTVQGDGSPCDGLDIVSIQWHAFTDTAIVVHAQNNNGSEIFDYPNFILFDANGDTLAVEIVNFFGIGTDSWHVLRVHDDAVVPNAPFTGTLELWTLFTQVLACSWELPVDLCPPPPCATFMPTIQNLGNGLAIGTYSWSIFDADFGLAASGQFLLTEQVQYDSDTICLPPGAYQMTAYPNDLPTGGQPYFSVVAPGFISGPSMALPWDLPVLMPFSLYLPCADGTNGVTEQHATSVNVQQVGDHLRVWNNTGAPLGNLVLLDAQGRVRYTDRLQASEAQLTVGTMAAGMYVLRTETGARKVVVQ